MDTDDLAAALASTTVVLFDFDGPICDVFAGRPADQVARELAALAARRNPELEEKLSGIDDPLEVLRLAHEADDAVGLEVEKALTAAEIEAVGVAGAPTPGAAASLEAVRASGRGAAVVSNNSAESVRTFLDQHELSQYVLTVVGRPEQHPELMKPNPHSLITAAESLDVDVTLCALIGDSLTDIQAAHAIGSTAIGYANKPHKHQLFIEAQAEAVTDSMQSIAQAIHPQPGP
ncbi:HAD family hydrolase [Streptomyces microflavus]|uniref:HAD family hydrolase n=1 Tax=Streptomyces microflavus TaxID=1919 RepID=UPI002E2EB186|nr:HAD hydrolase-like protein [Streptomyces microflavus]